MNTPNSDGNTDMSSPDTDSTATVDLLAPPPGEYLETNTSGGPGPGGAPRTRWAAVIWGVALAALAAGTLSIVADPGRREGFVDWLVALSPAAIAGYVILAVGALLLVAGTVGMARRLQRRDSTAAGA